ncbi:MAG: fliS [Acidimicrobiaceae bacterium]|nr:fliS [Acidimicrobiaceae bacterium]
MATRTDVAAQYAATASSTVTGPMLVVKLYDRLALDIEVGREKITAQDTGGAHEALMHAQRIVRVLRTSLQPDLFRGGADLVMLYDMLEHELVRANLEKDVVPLATCSAIVDPLHAAWTEAVTKVLSEQQEAEHALARKREATDAAVAVG